MAKKNVSPIMTWAFWSILVLAAFLLLTWEQFAEAFTSDQSYITWAILGFFFYGFASSLFVALYLQAEFKSLNEMNAAQRIGATASSDIAATFDAAMERIRRGDRIDVRNLVSAYGAKVKAKIDNVGVISGMLITIGLLGTVVGLIMTIKGLDTVLQSNSADFSNMKDGLNTAVSGMGTAFYTTFVGALLGGVVLKVIGSEMRKSALKIVADALTFSELYIAPQFAKSASESLVALEDRVVNLHGQLDTLGNSFGGVIETIDSKQAALAAGLGGLAETVEQTSREANERTEALVASVSNAIEATSSQADERLQAITSAMEQANAQAAERSNALIAAISQSVEGTTAQADERLKAITAALEQANNESTERANALVASITESIESTNRLADERLNTVSSAVGAAVGETSRTAAEQLEAVAGSVRENVAATNEQVANRISELVESLTATVAKNTEEANRLADERLQAVLKAVEQASAAAHEKADTRVAALVDNVEAAVEKSRKDAEGRLGAKAGELAAKLSEAASMLSGVVESAANEGGEGE